MKKKYDGEDDSFDEGYDDPDGLIIFEHFNDELSDEILNKSYKNWIYYIFRASKSIITYANAIIFSNNV